MSYHFSRTVSLSFDKAVAATTEALKNHGFGVLTQIDVKDTLHKKIGADFRPYLILGACNPTLAYEAYTANSDVASLLPCNAVVREIAPGRISLELAKPTAMMQILGDAGLAELAREADARIERALANA